MAGGLGAGGPIYSEGRARGCDLQLDIRLAELLEACGHPVDVRTERFLQTIELLASPLLLRLGEGFRRRELRANG